MLAELIELGCIYDASNNEYILLMIKLDIYCLLYKD